MSDQPPQQAAEGQPEDASVAPPPRREPVFNLPGVVVALIGICAAIHACSFYLLSNDAYFELLYYAAFIPLRYSGGFPVDIGSVVSPVTYSLLHGSLMHLVVNMVWLAAFGSPLANRLGAARFLLFWAAASLGAVAAHYAIYPLSPAPLVGASGAISGMMGAAARFAFRIDRSSGRPCFGGPVLPIVAVLRSRGAVAFLAIWMIVNMVTGLLGAIPGLEGGIAWEAHIGGFLVGFFLIGFFDRHRPGPVEPPPATPEAGHDAAGIGA